MAPKKWTNLELIEKVDSFPRPDKEPEEFANQMSKIAIFTCEDLNGRLVPLGYALKEVLTEIKRTSEAVRGKMTETARDGQPPTFSLFAEEHSEHERTKRAMALAQYLRRNEAFALLRVWRDELWPCYGPGNKDLLFSIERCAVGLLGLNRYGVHMIAFVKCEQAPFGIKLWVPRRAKDKKTWPGMLDNTVAGGLMTGEDPFDCIIREADEEASLPEAVVRSHAKNVGTVTYIYLTESGAGGEDGYVYPECQWVYDLELPGDIIPTPKDGEVDEFMLMTVTEVQEHLENGEFKPNCGLVTLDFFVRHGILTRQNEPDFEEVCERMHRQLPFPGPQRVFEEC